MTMFFRWLKQEQRQPGVSCTCLLLRTYRTLWRMALVQWRFTQLPLRLVTRCKEFVSWLLLIKQTLFYNEFSSCMVAIETAAEPLFWTVEKFSRYFGPVSQLSNTITLSSTVVQTFKIINFQVFQKSMLTSGKAITACKKRFCLIRMHTIKASDQKEKVTKILRLRRKIQ